MSSDGKKMPIVLPLLFLGSLVGVLIVVLQYSSPEVEFHDSDGDGVEDSRDVLPDGDAKVTFQINWSCECEVDVTLSYEPLNFDEQSLLDRAVIRNDTGGAETRLVDWPDDDEYLNMSAFIQGWEQYDFSIYYWGEWTMPDNSFGLNYTVTVIR